MFANQNPHLQDDKKSKTLFTRLHSVVRRFGLHNKENRVSAVNSSYRADGSKEHVMYDQSMRGKKDPKPCRTYGAYDKQ